MFTSIYQLLWSLLHLQAYIAEIFCWLILRLQALALWSYDQYRGEMPLKMEDGALLKSCRNELTKLPKHIIVVIGPEAVQINKEVMSRLFQYALTMNIEYVSVCDVRTPNKGYVSIDKVSPPKDVTIEVVDMHHIFWHSSNTTSKIFKTATINGHINGHSNGYNTKKKTIELHQTNPNDGRRLLADVCRQLFEFDDTLELQKLLQSRTQLTDYINDELKKRLHNMPDPDLGIIFNGFTCLYGLQPWQTRFTEFHTINPSAYFNAKTFVNVLYRYSKCEQRWGK